MNPSLAIVILNWNGCQDLRSCLTSLGANKALSFETIIVDNGSTDNSCSMVESEFPQATLIKVKENLGYAEGNNVGIRYALTTGHDYILILNNDTYIPEEFIKNLMEYALNHPTHAIIGGWPLLFSHPNTLDHLGGVWNPSQGIFELIGNRKEASFILEQELDYVCGCSILVKKEVFETIGLFASEFFLFWEEADFCIRAKKQGFIISVCRQAQLLHKVSASFTGGSPQKLYYFWRNRFLWIQRNCSPRVQKTLFWKIFIPKLLHLYKLNIIKSTELFFLKKFSPNIDLSQKHHKISQYRASIQGLKDFLKNRFGPASMKF